MTPRRFLSIVLIAGTLAFSGAHSLAQSAKTTAPASNAEATAAVHKKDLMDKFNEGGKIMYLIVLCSIATVYLAVDGVLRTSRNRVIPPDELNMVKDTFRQGDYVATYNYLKTKKSPFANVTRVGVSMLGEGKTAVEEAVMQELAKESSQVTFYISYLSVIGVCTPMIGLIGTVSGMIEAFETLGTAGIGDPSKLAAAIGEVLVATFSGLAIAVPAFALYYFLRNRATKAIHDIQDTLNVLFRKMPYEQLAGAHIGGEELYANTPNWVGGHDSTAAQINA
ncbi:MAG TPA: MotA/TolQ/ExbB proton channel family protein [Chthoniobacteraceae bacterium]|nr:MotA/TolQ/ExbB proton channel family protein [Chthoniobacteraceae bacterium]